MRKSGTWALVINAVEARILRDVEDPERSELVELHSPASSTHLRDIMADKPGRSFSSGSGSRRSAMAPGGDPVLRGMQDFAGEVGEFLEIHRREGGLVRLAVFADPKMLGILRAEFPPNLWDTVFLDLPTNLISLPTTELRDRVVDHIRSMA